MSGFSYKELYKQLQDEPTESTIINVVDELLKKTRDAKDIRDLNTMKDYVALDEEPAEPYDDAVINQGVKSLLAYIKRVDPTVGGRRKKTRRRNKWTTKRYMTRS